MKAAQDISSFFGNLKAFLPLANSHMVHFITNNMFENILPKQIQQEVNKLSVDDLNSIVLTNFTALKYDDKAPKLCEFLNKINNLYMMENINCLTVETFCEHLGTRGFSECSEHIVKNLMSVKKTHEVEIMSGLVAALAKTENCSHIVDVGGGKGYLSSVLALKHQLRVLSIDASQVTSKGAAKRIPKVEVPFNQLTPFFKSRAYYSYQEFLEESFEELGQKLWKTLRRKSKTESVDASQEEEQDETQEDSSQLLKLATLYISEDTDVVRLIKDNFPEDELNGMMLVGLHTCGNLAASSLRLFINNPSHLKCMVNVSCCYHLLMEEFDGNPSWLEAELQSSGFGFPMSAYLKDQDFALGRNARMLAAQPPERISSTGALETEKLFYRALIEFYLKKKLPDVNDSPSEWFRVGKIGRKCTNFIEYARKCVERLELDIVVDDEELHQLYNSHSEARKQLHAFFLLRLAVAPVIEAAVLLDRLLYLQEQGIEDAYLIKLFDPVVSPRCFAIVAFNR